MLRRSSRSTGERRLWAETDGAKATDAKGGLRRSSKPTNGSDRSIRLALQDNLYRATHPSIALESPQKYLDRRLRFQQHMPQVHSEYHLVDARQRAAFDQ